MATVQEWQDYVDAYDADSVTAQQHVNTVLNDPGATAAEKEKAVKDWMIQSVYSSWLHNVNDKIQDTGVIPATLHFDGANGTGGFWYDSNSQLRAGFLYPHTTQAWTDQGATTVDLPIVNFDGTLLSIHITSTISNVAIQIYEHSGLGPQWLIGSVGYDGQLEWSFGGVTISYGGYQYAGFCCNYKTYSNSIPQHNDFNNIARWSTWNSPNWNCDPTLGNTFSLNIHGFDVDPENPWDAYDNNILPNIDPGNAVFPNGYNPDPVKPDPDKPEPPGEGENGGPDIEPNDTTGIGGGFGFLTQYAIRATDIEILGKLLWAGFRSGSQQDIDNYLMNFVYNVSTDTGSLNFSDIMEFFVSLKMYPFPLANVTTLTAHGNHIHIGAGYTAIGDDPNLPHFPNTIYTMDSYLGKISAGSVDLPFWFRDYRDYSIQITLYLPYCGTVELNPGDVMGGTLDCDYYIDFCTGSCTAYVTCTSWDGHKFPVATMPGQIGADVPMSATNAGRIAARIYSDRIDHVENMVGAFKALTTGAGAIMSGNYAGAARQGFSAFIDPAINEEKLKAGMLDRGAIAAPVLSAGGGFTSFCNPSTCYVVYRSPFYPEIGNYPDSVGTPAAEQVTIGDCTGFCQFVNVDTSGITTDADAQKQIRDALAAGIYI